jgi:putative tryptophan/tyrosine transport system substrate-binding protein
MRSFFLIVLYFIVFLPYAQAQVYKVAVFDYDDRLDQKQSTAKYIQQQLTKKVPAIALDQYSGKANLTRSIKVLQELDTKGYDLIITITSDALIVAQHVIKQTPTLFTNVNNPLFLGFDSLGRHKGLISGASYYISVENQLDLYMTILPDLKRMGFIFDLNNKSKKVELPEVRQVCKKKGIHYRIEVVTREEELEQAVQRLIANGAEAVIIGSSDMLYNNISRFIDQCTESNVPVFSFNKKGVDSGAIAALSSDYNQMVDNLVIPMALEVLENKKSPGELPIAFLKENWVFINLSQARKINLHIPKQIINRAVIVR